MNDQHTKSLASKIHGTFMRSKFLLGHCRSSNNRPKGYTFALVTYFIAASFLMATPSSQAATGWYEDYILVSQNGGADSSYYLSGSGTAFAGSSFSITYGQTFELGADMKYWSDNQDRTGGAFYWTVNNYATQNEVIWSHASIGGNDYRGTKATEVNVASGLNVGSYTLIVWAKHWGSNQGDNFLNNGGGNYSATLN
ncbi:MAG: hypothetical protein ACO3ZG_09790, partial [Kiritimatiellia bacterium]